MKLNLKNIAMKIVKYLVLVILFLLSVSHYSCKKEVWYGKVSNDTVRVYLPWSQGSNTIFSVMDSNYVKIDTVKKKITQVVNVPIPVLRWGFLTPQTFTVDVSVDNTKLQSLITSGVLPVATTVVLPPDYFIVAPKDTLTNVQDENRGAIKLQLKYASIKTLYAGQKVAVGIKISNPTKYLLNNNQSSCVVLIDVDELVSKFEL